MTAYISYCRAALVCLDLTMYEPRWQTDGQLQQAKKFAHVQYIYSLFMSIWGTETTL